MICPKCQQDPAGRGGPCTVSIELDIGAEDAGAGSHARALLCAACGQELVSAVVALVQAQLARAHK